MQGKTIGVFQLLGSVLGFALVWNTMTTDAQSLAIGVIAIVLFIMAVGNLQSKKVSTFKVAQVSARKRPAKKKAKKKAVKKKAKKKARKKKRR
jgi:hypothetical protein